MKTYPRLIADGDLLWEGAILFPSMAPVVLSDANGWKLLRTEGVTLQKKLVVIN